THDPLELSTALTFLVCINAPVLFLVALLPRLPGISTVFVVLLAVGLLWYIVASAIVHQGETRRASLWEHAARLIRNISMVGVSIFLGLLCYEHIRSHHSPFSWSPGSAVLASSVVWSFALLLLFGGDLIRQLRKRVANGGLPLFFLSRG